MQQQDAQSSHSLSHRSLADNLEQVKDAKGGSTLLGRIAEELYSFFPVLRQSHACCCCQMHKETDADTIAEARRTQIVAFPVAAEKQRTSAMQGNEETEDVERAEAADAEDAPPQAE